MDIRALCWPASPCSSDDVFTATQLLRLHAASPGPDTPSTNSTLSTPRLSPTKRSSQTVVKLNSPSRKRSSPSCSSDEDLTRIMSKYLSGSVIQEKFSAEEAEREELRRQRSRVHQETHKRKKRKVLTDLQSSIQTLRDEIRQLEIRRPVGHSSVWEVASEFFRHFQYGVAPVDTQNTTELDEQEQWRFMRRVMAPDVKDGAVTRVDSLLETWRFLSQCFQDIDIKPARLENTAAHVLVAYIEGTVTISENTLCLAFPHLVRQERWSPLAAKLLDRQLVVHGSVQFEWDDVRRLVTGVRWEMDLLTPLLGLLGRLEDVYCVFDGALLTPDCRLATMAGRQI